MHNGPNESSRKLSCHFITDLLNFDKIELKYFWHFSTLYLAIILVEILNKKVPESNSDVIILFTSPQIF